MASDGTVLIPDGVGAIGPDGGQLWVLGDQVRREDGVVAIMTPYGEEYLVLPNQMIITPTGTLVDVPAIRQELLPDADHHHAPRAGLMKRHPFQPFAAVLGSGSSCSACSSPLFGFEEIGDDALVWAAVGAASSVSR